ncbi:MAG: response regulator [Gammaproteobacteria bacterium]|nr:response regulator [Gammaproteobacteria bacterium]
MADISLPELAVLVVEPSPTQRRIICRALQENGIRAAIECGSGEDALVRLANQSPDLVISSLYLPDMTGTDLVHRIRDSADFADTPFMLISSETRFRYLDPIRQAGVVGILPKPFSATELRTALVATVDMLDDSAHEIDDLDGDALQVLVVDDSALSRKHISRVLQSLGIRRIDHAEDGLRALEMIEQNYYDFIVTDYNMPRMDGKELIDHIRTESTQSSLPVLMVTSESNQNRLAAVQQSGVSAICDKPFEPAMVRQLVRNILDA